MEVLILVVMDDPLRVKKFLTGLDDKAVLILVVMDDPLRVADLFSEYVVTCSLNPCCNG